MSKQSNLIALRTVSTLLKFAAYLQFAVGTLFVTYVAGTTLLSNISTGAWISSLFFCELAVLTWALLLLAASELITVFLSIEENTRPDPGPPSWAESDS